MNVVCFDCQGSFDLDQATRIGDVCVCLDCLADGIDSGRYVKGGDDFRFAKDRISSGFPAMYGNSLQDLS